MAHQKRTVIANQSADWCGNPPVEWNQETIGTKNRNNPRFLGACRYISPLTGGLPHQCAHWFAMTAKTYKHQFAELPGKSDQSFHHPAGIPELSTKTKNPGCPIGSPGFCVQKSGIYTLSAASASWVKPSRRFRYIQLSTAWYSSSVTRRSRGAARPPMGVYWRIRLTRT